MVHDKHEEYAVYCAEQRACGYEVESYLEYIGEVDPKAQAYDRIFWDSYDNDLH